MIGLLWFGHVLLPWLDIYETKDRFMGLSKAQNWWTTPLASYSNQLSQTDIYTAQHRNTVLQGHNSDIAYLIETYRWISTPFSLWQGMWPIQWLTTYRLSTENDTWLRCSIMNSYFSKRQSQNQVDNKTKLYNISNLLWAVCSTGTIQSQSLEVR